MAAAQITLFDLKSVPPCKAWSLNPWKTRLVLNYKGLDYKTEWLEYPEIKPRFLEHFPKDTEAYTIPTVIMPDGAWIMDSKNIAIALEQAHPSPSLHLDSPQLAQIEALIPTLMAALKGIYLPLVIKRLLNEASCQYWIVTRERKIGMPLDQMEREQGGPVAWKSAAPHLVEATKLLRQAGEGDFFMGSTVSYADFVWAGFLLFVRRIGSDQFDQLLEASGDGAVHLKLLEAVKPWSERDDH